MSFFSDVGSWLVDDGWDMAKSFGSTVGSLLNNETVLGGITGAAKAAITYSASESDSEYNKGLLKLQQDKINADEARIKAHNKSLQNGPKEKVKQVYRS